MGISSFETRDYPFARVITQVQGVVVDVSAVTDSRDADGEQALAGLVMAKLTSGGKYVSYNAGGAGGAETADGILMHPIDITGGDVGAAVMLQGIAIESECHLVDAAAKVDLGKNGTGLGIIIFE